MIKIRNFNKETGKMEYYPNNIEDLVVRVDGSYCKLLNNGEIIKLNGQISKYVDVDIDNREIYEGDVFETLGDNYSSASSKGYFEVVCYNGVSVLKEIDEDYSDYGGYKKYLESQYAECVNFLWYENSDSDKKLIGNIFEGYKRVKPIAQ